LALREKGGKGGHAIQQFLKNPDLKNTITNKIKNGMIKKRQKNKHEKNIK